MILETETGSLRGDLDPTDLQGLAEVEEHSEDDADETFESDGEEDFTADDQSIAKESESTRYCDIFSVLYVQF